MAGINFKAFDLGGHEIARRVWKDYFAKVCFGSTVMTHTKCSQQRFTARLQPAGQRSCFLG